MSGSPEGQHGGVSEGGYDLGRGPLHYREMHLKLREYCLRIDVPRGEVARKSSTARKDRNAKKLKPPQKSRCASVGFAGWAIKAPDGTIYNFTNMRVFVSEHEELFAAEDIAWRRVCGRMHCQAATGLTMLSPNRKAPEKSWKGWVWAPIALK